MSGETAGKIFPIVEEIPLRLAQHGLSPYNETANRHGSNGGGSRRTKKLAGTQCAGRFPYERRPSRRVRLCAGVVARHGCAGELVTPT